MEIESSFRGVALEDGIGIFEAEALDACVSDAVREKTRRRDQRDSWESIPDETISQHFSVLCFMDQKGLRFHLPAYMRFAVRNYETSDSASVDSVIYALCRAPQSVEKDWPLFSEKQRATIAKFLKFMVLEAGEQFVDSWQASLAYERTWSKYESTQT